MTFQKTIEHRDRTPISWTQIRDSTPTPPCLTRWYNSFHHLLVDLFILKSNRISTLSPCLRTCTFIVYYVQIQILSMSADMNACRPHSACTISLYIRLLTGFFSRVLWYAESIPTLCSSSRGRVGICLTLPKVIWTQTKPLVLLAVDLTDRPAYLLAYRNTIPLTSG